jgi:ketosteroid isomerase-like protein
MGQGDTKTIESLKRAIEAFGEAWARGDAARLQDLLSPSYTHNDAFGAHLPYADWLAYAAKRTGRSTQIAFREVKFRLFGDIAIVTGFNDVTGGGATAAADPRDLTIIFTQIWRWENGRWLREAFQATPVVRRSQFSGDL